MRTRVGTSIKFVDLNAKYAMHSNKQRPYVERLQETDVKDSREGQEEHGIQQHLSKDNKHGAKEAIMI
jgi:hypothetical protein